MKNRRFESWFEFVGTEDADHVSYGDASPRLTDLSMEN